MEKEKIDRLKFHIHELERSLEEKRKEVHDLYVIIRNFLQPEIEDAKKNLASWEKYYQKLLKEGYATEKE